MSSAHGWRQRLLGAMPEDLAEEIDVFEAQVELRKQGRVEERVFAETRLRRGAYGQRYDNGLRHDGEAQKRLEYPSDLTKGPDTVFDAPGMLRIKIPYGGVSPEQLEVLADCAEEIAVRRARMMRLWQLSGSPWRRVALCDGDPVY